MINKEIHSELIIEDGKLTAIATDKNGVTVKTIVTREDGYYENLIEVIEKGIALDKAKPMKPINDCCPNCHSDGIWSEEMMLKHKYCKDCGQAIDWSENE